MQRSVHFRMVWSFSCGERTKCACCGRHPDTCKEHHRPSHQLQRIAHSQISGKKSCFDGNDGDRLNTAVHLLGPRYGGYTVIVTALDVRFFIGPLFKLFQKCGQVWNSCRDTDPFCHVSALFLHSLAYPLTLWLTLS